MVAGFVLLISNDQQLAVFIGALVGARAVVGCRSKFIGRLAMGCGSH